MAAFVLIRHRRPPLSSRTRSSTGQDAEVPREDLQRRSQSSSVARAGLRLAVEARQQSRTTVQSLQAVGGQLNALTVAIEHITRAHDGTEILELIDPSHDDAGCDLHEGRG